MRLKVQIFEDFQSAKRANASLKAGNTSFHANSVMLDVPVEELIAETTRLYSNFDKSP